MDAGVIVEQQQVFALRGGGALVHPVQKMAVVLVAQHGDAVHAAQQFRGRIARGVIDDDYFHGEAGLFPQCLQAAERELGAVMDDDDDAEPGLGRGREGQAAAGREKIVQAPPRGGAEPFFGRTGRDIRRRSRRAADRDEGPAGCAAEVGVVVRVAGGGKIARMARAQGGALAQNSRPALRITVAAAAGGFNVPQHAVGRVDDKVAALAQAQAKIDVVVGHGK